MSEPHVPKPVKLIASVFSRNNELIAAATEELSRKFGRVDFVSHVFPFNSTTYYNKEMGKDLVRRFLSFHRMILPHRLPDI